MERTEMSNPNRVVANMAKRPFECVRQSDQATCERMAAELAAQGFDVKVTSARVGSFKKPQRVWRVWKRDAQ
ncbi:hypothetical protein HMSP1_3 [Sinorhizobium phage HMSP1-Susan]|nr:hypothetical protein HMSP1_3 [Sinorhizobium phage HMSP1-Susan]